MGPLTKTPSPTLMRRPATSLSTSQSLHWESFADQGITRGICPETALVSPVAIPSGLSAPPITASSFSGCALCQYAVHNLILTLTFPSIACAKQKNDQDDAPAATCPITTDCLSNSYQNLDLRKLRRGVLAGARHRGTLLLRLYGLQHHQAHLTILIVKLDPEHAIRVDHIIANTVLRLRVRGVDSSQNQQPCWRLSCCCFADSGRCSLKRRWKRRLPALPQTSQAEHCCLSSHSPEWRRAP